MKKILVFAFTLMIIFTLAACGNDSNDGNISDESEAINDRGNENDQEDSNEEEDTSEEINDESSQDSSENNNDSDGSEEKIVATLDSGEIIINVYDNPTSRELLDQLPLTLTFEEYAGFEKLAYPPEELTTEGTPDGYTPKRGDFSYFSPWGNITFFYDSHRYSNGLVKMGEIESGVELLDDIDEDFTVTIERLE
ncbi:cyclophilin-like fold protein [Oceanobacillus sp. CFH 90083]|uniref:cyclophilin-like fold protein n=1 Tax=Oceanobacillus sp. CFH 90083 TaxID=2592336 RepID=UPI001D14F3A5|nr:cyclophilin-like fold protein [Oceanobacillus sp. CFH 90083]